VAIGALATRRLRILRVDRLRDFASFESLLAAPGPWHAACDFPFGQPRALVEALAWPTRWPALVAHLAAMGRQPFEQSIYAFMRARPPGSRMLHRRADLPAGSSSPMQLAYVPVGKMFFEGAPRLARSRVTVPRMARGDPRRVAVEGYPGLVARKFLGRESYKNDPPGRSRAGARARLGEALRGAALRDHYGFSVEMPVALAREIESEPAADALDAVLAAVQAAWSAARADRGLPRSFDRIEGWIADPATLAASPAAEVAG
jgi:hypothetical protein